MLHTLFGITSRYYIFEFFFIFHLVLSLSYACGIRKQPKIVWPVHYAYVILTICYYSCWIVTKKIACYVCDSRIHSFCEDPFNKTDSLSLQHTALCDSECLKWERELNPGEGNMTSNYPTPTLMLSVPRVPSIPEPYPSTLTLCTRTLIPICLEFILSFLRLPQTLGYLQAKTWDSTPPPQPTTTSNLKIGVSNCKNTLGIVSQDFALMWAQGQSMVLIY